MRIQSTQTAAARVVKQMPRLREQRDLQQPMKGEDVRQLQKDLAAAGFDPGEIDGEYGPDTERAVRAYQRARGCKVDGIVGPETRGALGHEDDFTPVKRPPVSIGGDWPVPTPKPAAPAAAPTAPTTPVAASTEDEQRQKILDIAAGEVGTLESGGNNKGDVTKYPEAFGRRAEKYCADFVSWVCTQAGIPLDQYNCETLKNAMEDQGKFKTSDPKPGDLVFFDWDGDGTADHVGIVKSVNADGTLTTIEGNTGDGHGGPEGVHERTRSTDSVLGYAYPG